MPQTTEPSHTPFQGYPVSIVHTTVPAKSPPRRLEKQGHAAPHRSTPHGTAHMSRYGDPFPSSSTATTGSSGYGGAAGVGDRWDTQRFFKERDERHEPALRRERRAAPPVDVLERPDRRASVSVEDYLRPPQQRYGAPARRPDRDYEDDHLVSSSDAIIPYKERRDISPHPEPRSRSRQPSVSAAAAPPPPPRPRFLRRQSSLDTFDRAATRRAHDYRHYDRDEYGPPVTPASVPQQRNPASFSEPDLDDVRIAEPDFYGDEEFRNMRQRERSETPRGRRYHSLREEVVREKVERPVPRRGKTRIPKRLVHIRAVIQLNYPFEDEVSELLNMPCSPFIYPLTNNACCSRVTQYLS